MKSCRRVALGCAAALAVLSLVVSGALYYMLTWRPPASVSAVTSMAPGATPDPSALPPDREGTIARLQETAATIEEAAAKPTPTPFEFRLTERELNEVLLTEPEVAQALQQQGIVAPQVDFRPGGVYLGADVKVLGRSVRLQASGSIRVEQQKLVFEADEMKLGLLPAPKKLRQVLVEELNVALGLLTRRLGARIESVEISETELHLRGSVGGAS